MRIALRWSNLLSRDAIHEPGLTDLTHIAVHIRDEEITPTPQESGCTGEEDVQRDVFEDERGDDSIRAARGYDGGRRRRQW